MSKIMYEGISYANASVSDATSIPTADMTAAFDSTAHMNSTDMTSQEVNDFVDNLDVNSDALGIVPDYGSAVSISSLPYTAPSFGIVIYTIGDGTNSGERNLTVNGVEIARARGVSGETMTVTALVSAGDIVSGALGIWGTMRFVPYSLGV